MANYFFEKQQAVKVDENITSHVFDQVNIDTTNQILQSSNILFDVYTTFVILEGELSSAEMKVAVGKTRIVTLSGYS